MPRRSRSWDVFLFLPLGDVGVHVEEPELLRLQAFVANRLHAGAVLLAEVSYLELSEHLSPATVRAYFPVQDWLQTPEQQKLVDDIFGAVVQELPQFLEETDMYSLV